MKKLFYISSIALTIIMLYPVVSLSNYDTIDNVTTSIKAGNAVQLATYFDNTVELTILTKQSNYSKAQAQVVLKDFFEKNPVKSFAIVHRGSSDAGSAYAIGTLTTATQTFRAYIYVKQKGKTTLVEELRFENSK
jgi:hypothetical protein